MFYKKKIEPITKKRTSITISLKDGSKKYYYLTGDTFIPFIKSFEGFYSWFYCRSSDKISIFYKGGMDIILRTQIKLVEYKHESFTL